MGISIKAVGDDLEFTFTRRKKRAVIERLLDSACRLRFSRGEGDHGTEKEPRTFEDLGTQEKLNLYDDYLTLIVIGDAETWDNQEVQRLAKEAKIPHDL